MQAHEIVGEKGRQMEKDATTVCQGELLVAWLFARFCGIGFCKV